MKKRLTTKKIIIIIVLLLLAAVFAFAGYTFTHMRSSGAQAQQVMASMETLIPGLQAGQDLDPAEGLPAGASAPQQLMPLSIDGRSVVGCLEVPALDLRAPVLDKSQEEAYFVTWVSGLPGKPPFRLEGGHEDVFRKLARTNPGDKVIFTDIDGNRYYYEVTTQYHLKDWAEATNDLLLCFPSDDQTDFVVGCTSTM